MLYCTLCPLTADASGQLNVLRHNSYTLGVDGTQVRVLEESHKVRFSGFLKSKDGRALEAKIRLEVLCNLSDKPLERKLADEKLGRLLVFPNLAKSDRSRAVTMGLLDTTCR